MNIQKYRDLHKTYESVNLKLIECIESTKPIGEMLSNATTLLLMSITLIALSLVEQKPTSVEVLGFSITTSHWLYLALPIVLMVLYLLINLISSGLLTLQQWELVNKPKLYLTAESISIIIKDSKSIENQIYSSVEALDYYEFVYFEPKFSSTLETQSLDEVKKSLQRQVDKQLEHPKAARCFEIYSQPIWLHTQALKINHELAKYKSLYNNTDVEIHSVEMSKALTVLKTYVDPTGKFNHLSQIDQLQELSSQYKNVTNLIITVGKKLDRLIKFSNILILFNFWFPLGFASISLLCILFQVTKTYFNGV